MNLGLDSRAAFVTGASSGIGRATALAFAGEGARVAVGYHSNAAAAQDAVDDALLHGAQQAVAIRFDLGDADSLDAAVEEVHARSVRSTSS